LEEKDTYNTIEKKSDVILFKDKNSKFYGYAFPITTIEDVKKHINTLKKEHNNARHWCYAWQLGTDPVTYRSNDDGEPNGSAGPPIYGQIKSFEVTNVLIVVVRYFGGVKLGVGGLISAYKNAAKMTLESSRIIEKTIDLLYEITFDYKNMNKIMRIIKEKNIKIHSQKMELDCKIIIAVRRKISVQIVGIFEAIFEVNVKKITS